MGPSVLLFPTFLLYLNLVSSVGPKFKLCQLGELHMGPSVRLFPTCLLYLNLVSSVGPKFKLKI